MSAYTPLRYPGGKARLYEYTKKLIQQNFLVPPIYAEAFAGGAGLAMKLLMTNVVSEIYINDYDFAIYCIWHSILNNNEQFKLMVKNAVFTIDEWEYQKSVYLSAEARSSSPFTKLEIGFASFYLNRTNYSGILTAGPIGGRSQKSNYSMNCRFNIDNLLKIITKIHTFKSRIHVSNCDAHLFIQNIDYKFANNCFFYLDPPYVQKGPILYKNFFDDFKHFELQNAVSKLKNKWFMTYDIDPLITNLYKDYRIETFDISYKVQKKKIGKEYAIFSNNIENSDKIIILEPKK